MSSECVPAGSSVPPVAVSITEAGRVPRQAGSRWPPLQSARQFVTFLVLREGDRYLTTSIGMAPVMPHTTQCRCDVICVSAVIFRGEGDIGLLFCAWLRSQRSDCLSVSAMESYQGRFRPQSTRDRRSLFNRRDDGGSGHALDRATHRSRRCHPIENSSTTAVLQEQSVASPLTASDGKQVDSSDTSSGPPNLLRTQMAVRRLTPRECERLQGFPDDYMPSAAPRSAARSCRRR